MIDRVFERVDARWRGLGTIPGSGLAVRGALAAHDAAARVEVEVAPSREPEGCRCGVVLRGELQPEDCPLFGERCTPLRPVGACMVSTEGSCHAAYRYRAPGRG
jgi:hydrogenase expression/formation protein HypD